MSYVIPRLRLRSTVFLLAAASSSLSLFSALAQTPQPTVQLSTTAKQTNVIGAGLNVEDASYLLKDNLLFDNQGFEQPTGAVYINCKSLVGNLCVSDNQYAQWPTGFANGWSFRPQIVGAGGSGTVLAQAAATGNSGILLVLDNVPSTSHLVLEGTLASRQIADISNWQAVGGGAASLETTDVGDGTQSVLLDGSRGDESLLRYFDNTESMHSGTQLKGTYNFNFMAKPGTSKVVTITVERLTASGTEMLLQKTQTLGDGWQSYSLPFQAAENGTQMGNGQVSIQVSGGSVLLDDISMPLVEASNPTPFRSVALTALQTLHPGSLRYMNGAGFAVRIDDAIAPINLRRPALSATTKTQAQLPSVDYFQALQLAQTLGSRAWITLPETITPAEMQNLMEWLGGSATTPYGAKRAARGQVAPWTSVFSTIYLELGNEAWNGVTDSNNAGDPVTYGQHANDIFKAATQSASWNPNITLVADGWNTNTPDGGTALYWEQNVRAQISVPFMMSEAPYLYGTFNDGSSVEKIYGPLFAETQLFDDPNSGLEKLIAADLNANGDQMGVYEENIGTYDGTATQAQLDAMTSTTGSGLAVADHMLQLIGLGVKPQNLFTLQGLHNLTSSGLTTNLWGAVIDIGGATDLKRPTWYAEQLVNIAALPTMLTTTQSDDPTYNSPASSNDSLPAVNSVQNLRSYAFTDGVHTTLALFNLGRSGTINPTLAGFPNATPTSIMRLTSPNITDTNELSALVVPTDITDTWGSTGLSLPPFSMTVYTWDALGTGVTPPVTTPPVTTPPVTTPVAPVPPTPPPTQPFTPVTPTPPAAQVAPPVLSLGGGVYARGILENITGAAGTSISYTLDGTLPNGSTVGTQCYNSVCPTTPMTTNTTLTAVACLNSICSAPVKALYVISRSGKSVAPQISYTSGDRFDSPGESDYFFVKIYGSYPFTASWTGGGAPVSSAIEWNQVTSSTIQVPFSSRQNGERFVATIRNAAGVTKGPTLTLHVTGGSR